MRHLPFLPFILLSVLALPVAAAHDDYQYDPVTVDEVCTAGNPGGGEEFCAALAEANAAVAAGCAEQGGDAGFCSVFGGNVHGLVQTCYHQAVPPFGNEGRRFCKFADTFVSAVSAYCRQVPGTLPELCALASSDLVAESQLLRYEESDLHAAHVLQRELSADQPMRHAMYVSTHNSFNATAANSPPTLSGSDANQRYLVVEQLRMDVRGLELDVHWMPSPVDGRFRATVCHGNAQHAGCSFEKSLLQELQELRVWLDAHPGEVIVIDLENNMGQPLDGPTGASRYAEASAEIFSVLGDRLYLPGKHPAAPACGQGQPLEVSVNAVRAAGRQVIVYGSCSYEHEGQALMFDRTGTHVQTGAGSYIDMQAPDDCRFTLEELDTRWVRFYEDGTMVGAVTGVQRQASVAEVREMARCNINMPSLDHLLPFDGRLAALLWSFDPEALPGSVPGKVQMVHNEAGRFVERAAQGRGLDKIACRSQGGGIREAGTGSLNQTLWTVGDNACPSGYLPGVPRNGFENELLRMAKAASGVAEVRLDLCLRRDGPAGGVPADGKRRAPVQLCR